MSGASAEQLYDLERQVRALAEEVDAARRIIPMLAEALKGLLATPLPMDEDGRMVPEYEEAWQEAVAVAKLALIGAGFKP